MRSNAADFHIHSWRSPHRRALGLSTHQGRLSNPNCGDEVEIYVRAQEDNLLEVTFGAQACGLCVAAASLLCVNVRGLTAAQALRMGEIFMRALGEADGNVEPWPPLLHGLKFFEGKRLNPDQRTCVELPWRALKRALV